jgi:hypothetical protein
VTIVSCSWCHAVNALGPGPVYCEVCEHRGDRARLDCDCPRCRRFEDPRDAAGEPVAVGSRVLFAEPYQGFAGGVVAEVLRGVLGPVAGVEVAPGRRVDVLCRRLRLAGG